MGKQKGITLVALVITIIILIILAGVSINTLMGENGIVTKAKEAKRNMILAEEAEALQLNQLFYEIETGKVLTEDITLLQNQLKDLTIENEELKQQIADLLTQNSQNVVVSMRGETNLATGHPLFVLLSNNLIKGSFYSYTNYNASVDDVFNLGWFSLKRGSQDFTITALKTIYYSDQKGDKYVLQAGDTLNWKTETTTYFSFTDVDFKVST